MRIFFHRKKLLPDFTPGCLQRCCERHKGNNARKLKNQKFPIVIGRQIERLMFAIAIFVFETQLSEQNEQLVRNEITPQTCDDCSCSYHDNADKFTHYFPTFQCVKQTGSV